MRKVLILCASLLTLGAASAWAAGVNLGWNDCPAGATYSNTRTFACSSNSGTNVLVGSFVAPASVDSVIANEVVIDIQTQNATLTPWWSLRAPAPTGCRNASMTQSGDFTTSSGACFDYWMGGASGGVSMDAPGATQGRGPNQPRIKVLEGVPTGSPLIVPIAENTEVYSFKVTINNAKTVGTGSCSGCTDQACIVLNMIKLNQALPLPAIAITSAALNQFVTWQGWTNSDPTQACPATTPAKQKTWGSIKALYR